MQPVEISTLSQALRAHQKPIAPSGCLNIVQPLSRSGAHRGLPRSGGKTEHCLKL